MIGRVAWFRDGIGFIAPKVNRNSHLFFHKSQIISDTPLKPDDLVVFRLSTFRGRPVAADVRRMAMSDGNHKENEDAVKSGI
jgi:cold shock CspA family protein